MAKKKRYFKLGKGAASYADTSTGLVLSGKQIVSIDAELINKYKSKKTATALTNGHLVELSASDVEGKTVVELPLPLTPIKVNHKNPKPDSSVAGKDEDEDDEDDKEDEEDENEEEDKDDEEEDKDDDEEDEEDEEEKPAKKERKNNRKKK